MCYYSYLLYYYIDTSCDVVSIYNLEWLDSRPEEHTASLDAVLESVVIFRVTSRAMAEIVVPLGFAEASFFSRRPVVLGVVAAAE